MPFDSSSLNLYPTEPGVYLMKDAKGRVLYIGKANNLRSRVKQYFSERRDERPMVPVLLSQVDAIETVVTLTEKDALILENNLIKQHQPKYNVLLKDDKTFVSLLVTQHQWPMVRLVRVKGKPTEKGTYFGPYISALSARKTFDELIKKFPLRQCSDAEFMSRKRPCLLYDIKRCIAPCVGKCTKEEYDQQVAAAIKFLRGQGVESPFTESCDALGLFREADTVVISLLQFRDGQLVSAEQFTFHQMVDSDEELVSSFLMQRYRTRSSPEILLPFALRTKELVEEILLTDLIVPQKGKKRDLIEMAQKNAKAQFERQKDQRSLHEKMLLDLQEALQLTRFPRRIECIDTSHLGGSNPVAALASFLLGEREKSRIRFFRIKAKEKAEDIFAMREALFRHFSRQKEENDFCDLLVVDGGKGQLSLAEEIFQELQIASVDLIALTKEQGRHDRGLTEEKIYLPHRPEPLVLNPRSPALFFLQRIRDETHRLAIGYHRKRTSLALTQSELDEISGIGPVKKRAILKKFGSVRALKATSREALHEVKELTQKDIEKISAALKLM